jgi:hypothetical protein
MYIASLGLTHHRPQGDAGTDDPIRQAIRRSSSSYRAEAESPDSVQLETDMDKMNNPFAVLSTDGSAGDGDTTAKNVQVEAEDVDVDVRMELSGYHHVNSS